MEGQTFDDVDIDGVDDVDDVDDVDSPEEEPLINMEEEAAEKDLGAQKSILKKSQGKKTTKTLKKLWTLGAGVAGLCFLFSNSFIGYAKKAAPVQMLFIWSLMMMTAAVFNMLFASSTIGPFNRPTELKLFALFPVGGFFFLAQIVAARRLPLGDCQAIFATVPAFTMIFGKIFLRIPCGLPKTLISSFLFIGTLFIARPFGIIPEGYVFSFEADPILNLSEHNITAALNNSKKNDPNAPVASLEVAVTARKITEEEAIGLIFYGIALLVPILSAIINVLNSSLAEQKVHSSVQVFWQSVGGLVVATIGLFFYDVEHPFSEWDNETWLFCLSQALMATTGTMLTTKALFWVEPMFAMVLRSPMIIVGFCIQVLANGKAVCIADLTGAVVIFACVVALFCVTFCSNNTKDGQPKKKKMPNKKKQTQV